MTERQRATRWPAEGVPSRGTEEVGPCHQTGGWGGEGQQGLIAFCKWASIRPLAYKRQKLSSSRIQEKQF